MTLSPKISMRKTYADLLRLALPVMLTQLGQVVVQLCDNMMVGRLGALPLAGVSFGGTVFFIRKRSVGFNIDRPFKLLDGIFRRQTSVSG